MNMEDILESLARIEELLLKIAVQLDAMSDMHGDVLDEVYRMSSNPGEHHENNRNSSG